MRFQKVYILSLITIANILVSDAWFVHRSNRGRYIGPRIFRNHPYYALPPPKLPKQQKPPAFDIYTEHDEKEATIEHDQDPVMYPRKEENDDYHEHEYLLS
ncbi:uncharacterized protein LOC144432405 [Styela clava]